MGIDTGRAALSMLVAFIAACGASSNGGAGGDGGRGGGVVACVDSVCPCTEAGIRDAVTVGGGPFTFDCEGPATVVTEAEIVIDQDLILDGEDNLTVDGNDAHRVFSVPEGVSAELHRLNVTRGNTGPVDWFGAGIFNRGTLMLSGCTVSDNVTGGDGAGGGIFNDGTLTLSESTLSGNTSAHGGAIESSGTLTLSNSTVSGNRADRLGGGIINSGTATLSNSTVSGNSSALSIGGLQNLGALTVIASTFSGNTVDEASPWSKVSIDNHGTLTLSTSVVDGDCTSGGGPGASIVSRGYNVESEGDTCGFDQPTDQVSVDADDLALGALQDNGGPTMTHALGEGSLAIDVIPADDCEVETDQRGEPRDATCDVGAFEVQAL